MGAALWGLIAACLASGTPAPPTAVANLPSASPSPAATLSPTASPSPTPSFTFTPSPTLTSTPTSTRTPTSGVTPTPSASPSATLSPTPTIDPAATPTFVFPTLVARLQSNCRYGPGTAYLFAHGMYPGDRATIWGRNTSGSWLYIQPDNIHYQCWISASVVDVTGDIFTLVVQAVRLPRSTLYGPVQSVWATRSDDTVLVEWEAVWMTEDDNRGYMIEANVCQNGALIWMAVATMETRYEFLDEPGCSSVSNAQIYVVEKHGYTDPVPIPWP